MNPADFGAPPASACTQGTGGADRITRNVYFPATYDALDRQTWIHEQGVNGRVVRALAM